MSIRWITEHLGTAPYGQFAVPKNAHVVDVRDMVDQSGNTADLAMAKVDDGAAALRRGQTVVVCCDYGISRSNAVAAGVLARYEGVPYDSAVTRVMEATGECRMQIGVVHAVRAGLEGDESGDEDSRLLVTGVPGIVGTAFLNRVGDQADIIAPRPTELDLLGGAVELDLIVRRQRPSTVLHLANPRMYTVSPALGETLVMLKNVIDVCLAQDLRLIYPSSWEVFSGYRSNGLLATPELPANPGGTHGQTKLLAEVLLEHHQRHSGLKLTLLRASPVYGAGDQPKFIQHFIAKALRSEPIHTHRYRNGDPGLDLLHIDDFTALLDAVCANPFDGVINAGTGKLTTTPEIARCIVELADSKSAIGYRSIHRYAPNIQMDITETCAMYDWQPQVSLINGLSQLVALHRVDCVQGDTSEQ